LRFKNLGSGSAGNATLIQAQSGQSSTQILIDCGLSMTELSSRLERIDLELSDLDALFITHEHSDHVGHARQFGLRTGKPIWCSQGTQLASQTLEWGLGREQLCCARDGETIEVGELQITPFTVPHDAREPLQVCLSDGNVKLGLVTDLGHASAHVLKSLQHCQALILEANHDQDLLRLSKYPSFLKSRISGPLGHLSNQASAELLKNVMHDQLKTVVAAHLSEKNNTPQLVGQAFASVLNCAADEVIIAHQDEGTEWWVV
jgi:phosphoribosyl 1,2-cyclic phosphodiesterase